MTLLAPIEISLKNIVSNETGQKRHSRLRHHSRLIPPTGTVREFFSYNAHVTEKGQSGHKIIVGFCSVPNLLYRPRRVFNHYHFHHHHHRKRHLLLSVVCPVCLSCVCLFLHHSPPCQGTDVSAVVVVCMLCVFSFVLFCSVLFCRSDVVMKSSRADSTLR